MMGIRDEDVGFGFCPALVKPNAMYRREMKNRCEWSGNDPLYVEYHDNEWGVPVHDDRRLFEMLILEGAHAGLSWLTILLRES